MEIDIGSRMIVEFSNKARMNCRFVGLSKDEFLLLKVPMSPGIRDRMGDGVYLEFRYLKDGKIIGFGAEVLRYQATPVSLVFLSYPKEFTEYNLRKEGRVECRFPTELAIEGTTCTGHIVDISPKGCRFVFDGNVAPKIEDKASVAGSFSTMESSKKYAFKGTVTGMHSSDSEKGLGVKFDEEITLPEGVLEQLKHIADMREIEKSSQEEDA